MTGWALTAALVSVPVFLAVRESLPPTYVNVRWTPQVNEAERAELEHGFRLDEGRFREQRTWTYRLLDVGQANVRALVEHPGTEDTSGIDRETFDVAGAPGPLTGLGLALLIGFAASTLAWFGGRWFTRACAHVSRLVAFGRDRSRADSASIQHPRLALFALATAIFTFAFHQVLNIQQRNGLNDFGTHIDYAKRIHSLADITSPHFLFQLLIKVIHETGLTYETGSAWLLGVCYGGMALLIARELERRRVALTVFRVFFFVPALLLASHIFLFTAPQSNLYFGYFVPIFYHNPTQQLNKLFTLWIFFSYCAHVLGKEKPSLGRMPWLGGLCILSALAKPSFLIAFLPASGLLGLRDLARRRWRHVLFFVGGIALPSVAVLLWQAQVRNEGAGISVVYAPFAIFNIVPTLYKLPLSFAFPLTVAIVAIRTSTDRLRFVWAFTAFALFATLFLAESGPDIGAGNFAWTGQTAAFLAYVESALFLLTEPLERTRMRAAWTVFALHVGCGVFWYFSVFIPNQDALF